MINNLYLEKNFNRDSNLFSIWARFSCMIRLLQWIKYVLFLCFAASIPMDTDKCVFPTPGEPMNKRFSTFSIKRRSVYPIISSFHKEGWKLKLKSSIVLINGKLATLTQAFIALLFLSAIANSVISYNVSRKLFSPFCIASIYSSRCRFYLVQFQYVQIVSQMIVMSRWILHIIHLFFPKGTDFPVPFFRSHRLSNFP